MPPKAYNVASTALRFNSAPIDLGREICVYGRDPFGNTIELIETKPA